MKCGEHAKIIEVLSMGSMGPNVKTLYDKLMENPEEECIQAESQVMFLFSALRQKDQEETASE